jgi:hypothetical protein
MAWTRKTLPLRTDIIFTRFCIIQYIIINSVNITMPTGIWWGSLKERGHWGDEDIDGKIILRWIFRKMEGVVGMNGVGSG